MNKNELINTVVEKLTVAHENDEKAFKLTKKSMAEYVDVIFDTIAETMVAGDDVKIANFGNFSVVERAERAGHNPATGESMIIPATKAPKFKASSVLKAAVKGE